MDVGKLKKSLGTLSVQCGAPGCHSKLFENRRCYYFQVEEIIKWNSSEPRSKNAKIKDINKIFKLRVSGENLDTQKLHILMQLFFKMIFIYLNIYPIFLL